MIIFMTTDKLNKIWRTYMRDKINASLILSIHDVTHTHSGD